MLISKFIGYVLIHLLNLGVTSALPLKTFIDCKSLSIGTCKINKEIPPEVCEGGKLIQLISLSNLYYFRATSVHDMA